MSNYQRLISYIYTYEGGIKGKNTGFAKLETRNGQCRLTVNVKKIFVGGNPLGVYLLSEDGEFRIGTLFARNGAGEFRAVLNAGNVEGSQKTLEEFHGLTIHDVESGWRTYTTVWEDAVAHAAAVDLAGVTAENVQRGRGEETEQSGEMLPELALPIAGEIEKELAREDAIEQGGAQQRGEAGVSTQEGKQSDGAVSFAGTGKNPADSGTNGESRPGGPESRAVRGSAGEPVMAGTTGQRGEQAERVWTEASGRMTGDVGLMTETGGRMTEAVGPEEIGQAENQENIQKEELAAGEGTDSEGAEERQEPSAEPAQTEAGVQNSGLPDSAGSGYGADGREIVRQMEAAPEQRESRTYSEEFVIMPGRRAVGPAAGELQSGIRARLIGRSVPPVNGAFVREKNPKTDRDSAADPLTGQKEQPAYGRARSRKRPRESMSAGEWARQLNGRVFSSGSGVGTVPAGAAMGERQKNTSQELPSGVNRGQESRRADREREEMGGNVREPEEFMPLDLEDPDTLSHQRMWARLRRKYPKILAFDYDDGCEILTIKPQDIGLLPREVWVFGNNSFLLHGYYSYRYLILARLENPEGEPRYLLGVPGHYHPNEKYMASMFGFPDFVLSKKQPSGDDCFGYWYTDIRVGE